VKSRAPANSFDSASAVSMIFLCVQQRAFLHFYLTWVLNKPKILQNSPVFAGARDTHLDAASDEL
jgi:hypothetical protein